MILKTEETKNGFVDTELNHFRPDKRDGKGFDMDLLSIDRIYRHGNRVYYASRDLCIRANWLTSILQRLFGVNE